MLTSNDHDLGRNKHPNRKTALIVGGSGAIGQAIARQFVTNGYKTVITWAKNEDVAKHFIEDVNSTFRYDGTYHHSGDEEPLSASHLDLRSSLTEIQTTTTHIIEQLGHLSVLVLVSGINHLGLIDQQKPEAWHDVLNVNLIGTAACFQAAAIAMKGSRTSYSLEKEESYDGPLDKKTQLTKSRKRIIIISSINADRGREGSWAYNASKAGLNSLTLTAARELGEWGINVNGIAPGFIDSSAQEKTPPLIRKIARQESALGRLGRPEDVAHAVCFLASDEAEHITGHILRVDGGQGI